MNTTIESEFGLRLTELHTGARGLREGLHVKTSVPADAQGEPVVEFISSDETLDRYSEVICASGWVLDAYLKNPVFQDSHDYSTILRTIGKAVHTEVRILPSGAACLFQRIVFAVAENPLAKIAYELYRGGFLNAVSVGFIPLEWEIGDATASYRRKYLKQELLETSAVAIPANPNALELACKSGAIGKSDLRELLQLLKHLTATGDTPQPINLSLSTQNLTSKQFGTTPAASHTDTSALGIRGNDAQTGNALVHVGDNEWVQLMRQVAALYRRA